MVTAAAGFLHWQLPPSIALSSSMIACDQTVSGAERSIGARAAQRVPSGLTSFTVQMCGSLTGCSGDGLLPLLQPLTTPLIPARSWFQSLIVQGADMLHLLMLRAATHETT